MGRLVVEKWWKRGRESRWESGGKNREEGWKSWFCTFGGKIFHEFGGCGGKIYTVICTGFFPVLGRFCRFYT